MSLNTFRRGILKTLAASPFVGALALAQAPSALAQAQAGAVKVAIIEGLSGPFANTGEAVARNTPGPSRTSTSAVA